MTKKAICILRFGDIDYYELTKPLIEAYAQTHNYDIIEINRLKYCPLIRTKCSDKFYICYEKYQVIDILKGYDFALMLDADMVIHPDCPDVLEHHETGRLSGVPFASQENLYEQSKFIKIFGAMPKKDALFNGGLLALDKQGLKVMDEFIDKHNRIDYLRFAEQDFFNLIFYGKKNCLDKKFNSPTMDSNPCWIKHFCAIKNKYDKIKSYIDESL